MRRRALLGGNGISLAATMVINTMLDGGNAEFAINFIAPLVDYYVDWGDDTFEKNQNSHSYNSHGMYTINIYTKSNVYITFSFKYQSVRNKLVSVTNSDKINLNGGTFFDCINLSNFQFSKSTKLTSLLQAFYNTKSLSFIDISNLTIPTGTPVYEFCWGVGLKSINANNTDISELTDISSMFFNCTNLLNPDFSTWIFHKKVTVSDRSFMSIIWTGSDAYDGMIDALYNSFYDADLGAGEGGQTFTLRSTGAYAAKYSGDIGTVGSPAWKRDQLVNVLGVINIVDGGHI